MTKNFNPTFGELKSKSAVGYSAFPMDHLVNFTSAAGYLIPVYWDFLSPGDKVNMRTLLRTQTQPLTKPAMATCIERIEWFAVPIDQLYKPFSAKFYGINDISTDLLPTSGYDDYLPWISLQELQTYVQGLPTSPQSQSASPSSQPLRMDAMRLCHALGLTKYFGYTLQDGVNFPAQGISALPFAAYHKIYSDHYRLTDREENDPSTYNLDSFNGSSDGSSAKVGTGRFASLLQLHKRPYMRDYFTSMHVSPLFGSTDVNASGTDLGIVNQWLNGLDRVTTGEPTSVQAYKDLGGLIPTNTTPTGVRLPNVSTGSAFFGTIASALNPTNIRSLFAVEKLLEVTRRAKKHYDMQTLAHFGVDVPKGLAGECMKLGTFEQFLRIGEVVSTSNTSEGSLGELAGRGSSEGQSKNFDFEAKCHCVLMAIYSVEPVVNIASEGIPRQLTMSNASDFYKSEFDNLGLQPVFHRELFAEPTQTAPYSSVIGWQPRYQQLKARYNRSFAGCADAAFSEWSLNRERVAPTAGLSRNFFYVWPTDLNDILLVPYTYSFNPTSIYANDYFVSQIYFDVQKASKMSVFGVPNL